MAWEIWARYFELENSEADYTNHINMLSVMQLEIRVEGFFISFTVSRMLVNIVGECC